MLTIKSYAKLNLTLNILGVESDATDDNAQSGNRTYHNLDSIVTTIDLYDAITLTPRQDKKVKITMHGEASEKIPPEQNNALKSAYLFIEKFNTNGVDIEIQKNIPMGLGVGGSSADSSGVLNGLSKLYNIDDFPTLCELADKLGSDNRYMLQGGYARLFKRGNQIKKINSPLQLYFLLVDPDEGVSTAECYKLFDRIGKVGGNSDQAERAILQQDLYALSKHLNNALIPPAKLLSPKIAIELQNLKTLSPLAVNMTGSGSGVYALFATKEECKTALTHYQGTARIIPTKTLTTN